MTARSAVCAPVLAALAVAGAAGPAVAAAPAHTSLSIRASALVVDAGARDTISGTLGSAGSPVPGAAVTLLARPTGQAAFHPAASATTGSRGRVAFAVTPQQQTAYELLFSGTERFAGTHSGIVTVAVRRDGRARTSLSIRASRNAVDPGGHATVAGALHARGSALADRKVALQQRPQNAGGWSHAATKRTGPHGYVHFLVHPAALTRYRLVFHRHPHYRAAASGVVTINVRTPATLSISIAATAVEPGSTDTVGGVLRAAGEPVAGQPVVLLSRAVDADSWTRLASSDTGSDGSVAFTVTPGSTTRYLLRHPRTYRYTAARSAVTTVTVREGTSLSIRAATDSVPAGGSDTISGTLLAADGSQVAGATVTLMARPSGAGDWTALAAQPTGDHGYVAFSVTPASSTDYQLVFAGDEAYDGSSSGVVTVTAA